MDRKPKRALDYQPESVHRVRRTLLFIASKLGDLMDDIVVVGGLVPYLIVDQRYLSGRRRHVGTMDLDLGLSLAILNGERYREVAERLRSEGFRAELKAEVRIRRQTWGFGSGSEKVTVDFLIQPNEQQPVPGKVTHIEPDLAALTMEGIDLAFMARRRVEISDQMPNGSTLTRKVHVAGPGAFVVLKAIAYHNRTENKDAYDLFYVLREVGVKEVAEDFGKFPPNHSVVERALDILRRDFVESDAGRSQAAEFIEGRRDYAIEADVLAAVTALMSAVG